MPSGEHRSCSTPWGQRRAGRGRPWTSVDGAEVLFRSVLGKQRLSLCGTVCGGPFAPSRHELLDLHEALDIGKILSLYFALYKMLSSLNGPSCCH